MNQRATLERRADLRVEAEACSAQGDRCMRGIIAAATHTQGEHDEHSEGDAADASSAAIDVVEEVEGVGEQNEAQDLGDHCPQAKKGDVHGLAGERRGN